MDFLEANIEMIKKYLNDNLTYQQISELFKQTFPEVRRGFSARNIRLICSKYSLGRMNEVEVDSVVQQCINEVTKF
jgi:hypothetical protein